MIRIFSFERQSWGVSTVNVRTFTCHLGEFHGGCNGKVVGNFTHDVMYSSDSSEMSKNPALGD